MRAVELAPGVLEEIERHAREDYPNECCGFTVTPEKGTEEAPRRIVAVEPAPNEYDGERRRRFAIAPPELRAAEQRARTKGGSVSGFYHSHPDHPPQPSQFDEDHAWPWYTYLVVSVDSAGKCEVGAFELDAESRRFERVPLTAARGERPAPSTARASVPEG